MLFFFVSILIHFIRISYFYLFIYYTYWNFYCDYNRVLFTLCSNAFMFLLFFGMLQDSGNRQKEVKFHNFYFYSFVINIYYSMGRNVFEDFLCGTYVAR